MALNVALISILSVEGEINGKRFIFSCKNDKMGFVFVQIYIIMHFAEINYVFAHHVQKAWSASQFAFPVFLVFFMTGDDVFFAGAERI